MIHSQNFSGTEFHFQNYKWLIPYTYTHKMRIFGNFPKAEVGEGRGGGLAFVKIQISCKTHTTETIIECTYFNLKNM